VRLSDLFTSVDDELGHCTSRNGVITRDMRRIWWDYVH